MRRAVDVRLVLLSASVIFANSLVIKEQQWTGKEDKRSELAEAFDALLHPSEPGAALLQAGRDAVHKKEQQALLQAGRDAVHKKEQQSELADAFQDLVQARENEFTLRVKMKAAARGAKGSAKSHSSSVGHASLAQRSGGRSGNVSQVADEQADLLLANVFSHVDKKHATTAASATGWRDKLASWEAEHESLRTQGERMRKFVVKCLFSVCVWAVLCLAIGLFYHHEKQHPPKLDHEGVNVSLHDRERLDRHRWRFGLFECAEVPALCCFSFFCAPIRWADTMRMAGFMNYYSALALVVGITVLGSLTLGMGFVALIGVFAYFRHRMREKFDVHSYCGIYAMDVLAFVFCPVCSIVQEARQMEEAYLARHASVRDEYMVRKPAIGRVTTNKV